MHDAKRWAGRLWVRSAAAGGCGLLLLLTGCASYANVPEPESSPSVTSPNARQPRAAMTAALQRVLRQYPPGRGTTRFAVNLPTKVSPENAAEILAALGPGAELATLENAELPTYDIGRIWIRAGSAKVDIFRPVVELGRQADGTYEQQAITVWMEGGLGPWRTVRTQKWAVGAFPRPELSEPEVYEGDAYGAPAEPPASTSWEDGNAGAREDAAPEVVPAPRPTPEPTPDPEPTPTESWTAPTTPPPGPAMKSGDETWFKVEPIGEGG